MSATVNRSPAAGIAAAVRSSSRSISRAFAVGRSVPPAVATTSAAGVCSAICSPAISPSQSSTEPTLAVSPDRPRIFSTYPSRSAGTSRTALSVSTAPRIWPRLTNSPSLTRNSTTRTLSSLLFTRGTYSGLGMLCFQIMSRTCSNIRVSSGRICRSRLRADAIGIGGAPMRNTLPRYPLSKRQAAISAATP